MIGHQNQLDTDRPASLVVVRNKSFKGFNILCEIYAESRLQNRFCQTSNLQASNLSNTSFCHLSPQWNGRRPKSVWRMPRGTIGFLWCHMCNVITCLKMYRWLSLVGVLTVWCHCTRLLLWTVEPSMNYYTCMNCFGTQCTRFVQIGDELKCDRCILINATLVKCKICKDYTREVIPYVDCVCIYYFL